MRLNLVVSLLSTTSAFHSATGGLRRRVGSPCRSLTPRSDANVYFELERSVVESTQESVKEPHVMSSSVVESMQNASQVSALQLVIDGEADIQFNPNIVWRRLVTRTDFMHAHKTFAVTMVVSNLAILAYGLGCLVSPLDPLAQIPTQPLFITMCVGSVVSGFASMPLAYTFRRDVVLSAFLSSAWGIINVSIASLWATPWWPAEYNSIASFAFILSAIPFFIYTAEVSVRAHDALKELLPKHLELDKLTFTAGTVVYILPAIFFGLGVFAGIVMIGTGRPLYDAIMFQHPRFLVVAAYAGAAINIPIWSVPFLVTLQDKNLITMRQFSDWSVYTLLPGLVMFVALWYSNGLEVCELTMDFLKSGTALEVSPILLPLRELSPL